MVVKKILYSVKKYNLLLTNPLRNQKEHGNFTALVILNE